MIEIQAVSIEIPEYAGDRLGYEHLSFSSWRKISDTSTLSIPFFNGWKRHSPGR